LAGEVCAQEPSTSAPSSQTQETAPVKISADHMVQSGEKNVVKAWGHVVIRYEGRILKADRVKINTETGKGAAAGNVWAIAPDGTRFKSQRTLFNIKSSQGQIFYVQGRVAKNYFVKSKKITRLSDTHFQMDEGALTTCRGKIPDWVIEAKSIDLITGDRALFTGAKLKVHDIPVMYIPAGYIPVDQTRKSGILFPTFGSSNTDGFTMSNAYYWAINRQSDATVYVDYLQKRGVRPGLEYRYTPSHKVHGEIRGSYLEDDDTNAKFWKVDMSHYQELPEKFTFLGRLDLESDESFNKTFEDNPNKRTRRNSDSYATLTRSWDNHSLDILARYRDSTESGRDDTFAQLPQVTFKTQRMPLGKSGFYFNQDTSFSSFLIDLNPDPLLDDKFTVQRFDFHPQLSLPIGLTPWMSLTPTVGVRETYYSKGYDPATLKNLSGFSRESYDVRAVLEGPKFNKIFETGNSGIPKIKHVVEPRFIFEYLPNLDADDRRKIRVFDNIDSIKPRSLLSFSLTQRILQKELDSAGNSQTREALRFVVSQSYDFREAVRDPSPISKKPFSDIRFDLDSRLIESLILNADTTYDIYDNQINSFNFEMGIKPRDTLSLIMERRYIRNESTFWTGTLDWAFRQGWNFQYSARFDENAKTFRENDLSLLYDDPCECWGFSLDFIQRNIVFGGLDRDETKFMLGITLRGLGSISTGRSGQLIHRKFDEYYNPQP